ncbi:bifunctional diaminohydroxyphosphoribosylaminopyrimidine deaminase/5-amino-6-(5-phosphoribosylamino)uracil reductase RibD [Paenibacillus beijingensis]|uniref:Riboflavin biosynthesis protein RibD n=1 Tax=Paenibacillus beijingensis TaxID=1126833 RepID=A0A0D5NQN2_9BACL|nr:bifunctional diaminohydroxyphosphoribosylaminopyrimidine deaminase/5-amino-6-(5-phosphoribosylamino)uracil reductase RibD [Paenibacillus beijingensis]AJY77218.1 5-amino-6-(5-phosphoribosylamino)uracil reductase [Paenibacillus beijingensis]
MDILNDEFYMDLALNLASKALGQTSVNPVVGCVVVKDGRIIGVGTHLKRGTGHAEVHALNMAGEEAEGATVYVTLEPCSHFGKTPPCCERIIAAKAARVVVACTDPNPLVAGRGLARLREAGIEVKVGVLGERSMKLNEAFNKFITTGLPFVTLKSASTLDGKIAAKTGDSRWVTSPASREAVHMLRHRHMGIMVGIGTVLADDPSLTTRLPVPGIHPVRIVVDSALRMPLGAKLVQDQAAPTVIVTTESSDASQREALEAAGVKVVVCGAGPKVDLTQAMKRLGELEIGSVLLEAGGTLSGAMLDAGLVDKMLLFIAPKLIGGANAPVPFQLHGFDKMSEAIEIEELDVQRYGSDICLSGYPANRRRIPLGNRLT